MDSAVFASQILFHFKHFRQYHEQTPPYTDKQGQYLVFVHYDTRINGRPPAEAELQRFFEVTPPTVHCMILELESKGLLQRTPAISRSLRVFLPFDQLPPLRG